MASETYNRRNFFKKSARLVLPILGLIAGASWETFAQSNRVTNCPGDCNATCKGLCAVGCDNGCIGTCRFMCGDACTSTCANSCHSSCSRVAEQSTTSKDSVLIQNDTISLNN